MSDNKFGIGGGNKPPFGGGNGAGGGQPPKQPVSPSNGGGGGRGGASGETSGLVIGAFWIGLIVILWFLIINPITGLLFGNDEFAGVYSTVKEYINGEIELGISDIATQVIFTLIAVALIPSVVYMPTETLRSPLHFASMHILKGINDLLVNKNIKNDMDEMKNVGFKIGIYSLVLIGIFVTYFFLVDGIVNAIVNNGGSIELIGLMVMIAVIAGGNSWLVGFLDQKDPMFNFKNNAFQAPSKSNIDTDSGKRIGLGLLFLFINIVFLGVASAFSTYVIDKYDGSSIHGIVEGQASSVEDLNLFGD